MSRASTINVRQIRSLYWPTWRAAEKILRAHGYTKEEAEEKRQEIHMQVTGSACSSKDLTNRTLDAVLAIFLAIAQPANGARQAELADGPSRRIRYQIEQLRRQMQLTDVYIDGIAHKMHHRPFTACTEQQLQKILAALTYHSQRHP